ncbi:MAG TPA: alpha/beta hydrolase [Burkholderiaceae bacterium]
MAQTPYRVGAAPTVHEDGTLRVQGVTSPVGYKIRHGVPLGPDKVIPVVFVPGIMGSNLVTVPDKPGAKPEIAWQPPNGKVDGLKEVNKWKGRSASVRQNLLNPDATALDENGPILAGSKEEQALFRQRGWGSVHHDSYGDFLYLLHNDLNQTLELGSFSKWRPCSHWQAVIEADRKAWDAQDLPALTLEELTKFADHQFPVYAAGYNWLQCNDTSAQHIARKIDGWMASWKKAGLQCDKVILVSHSMGGLVSRAYAKRHPDKVLGVLHGVLPAVGTPAAYRRMACGAEQDAPGTTALPIGDSSQPSPVLNDFKNALSAGMVSWIIGRTPAETQPVLAASPGALELLPCHPPASEYLSPR